MLKALEVVVPIAESFSAEFSLMHVDVSGA